MYAQAAARILAHRSEDIMAFPRLPREAMDVCSLMLAMQACSLPRDMRTDKDLPLDKTPTSASWPRGTYR
jgi:hypothetical protein